MNSIKAVRGFTAIALLSASLLTGCIVAPAPGYYRGAAVVTVAPPEPRVEVVGVAPTADMCGSPDFGAGKAVLMFGTAATGVRDALGILGATRGFRYGGGWRMSPGHWVRR